MTVSLPFDQPSPVDMPPLLRTLQQQGTVHRIHTRVGDDAWLITDYQQVRRLLDDPRLGRAHPEPAHAARSGESALFGGPLGNYDSEKNDHTRMRSLLQPHFAPRRMKVFRPRVERLTTELLDTLHAQGPPADLHAGLALPLPILVICELLGVPYDERTQFRAWTRAAADIVDRPRSEQGLGDLFAYGQTLVARKRRTPGDDIISALCATEGVPDDEIAMLSMALLFAGHETTVVQIGLGAALLLTHPAQWQAALKDPALLPGVVEEILRMPGNSGGGIPRYARTDIEIDGTTIPAGDLVMLDTGAANHDPAAFTDPDTFDATRSTPAHLTFGHGARYCIGAPLARMELHAVFAQLIPRFSRMRLAVPLEELRVREDLLTGGLESLPVTW